MYPKIFFVLMLFLISNINADDSIDEAELLRSLFGKNISTDVKDLSVPVIVNGHGFISIKIDIKNNEVFLKKDDIKKILDLTVLKYEKKLEQKERVSMEFLKKEGIGASYYKDDLIIKINIPPKYFKTNTIIFNKLKEKKRTDDAIETSSYSGVSNYYIQQGFSDTDEKRLKSKDLNIRNNFFFNIYDYILNGSLSFQESSGKKLNRGNIFLEKDNLKRSKRYKLGEIYLPTHFRLSSIDSLGFSSSTILKLFKMNHKNTIRVNQYEFFLESDSSVKLYINDIYKRSFDLRAGTHNFYDLYIPEGLNEVKLEITDKYGEMETIVFNDYKYNDILSQGTFLYGYGLGVKREVNEDEVDVRGDKLSASYIIKYGLSDNITVESGAKIVDKHLSQAYDIYFGTKFGKINCYYTDDISFLNDIKNRYIEKGVGLNTRVFDISFNLYTKKRDSYKAGILNSKTDTSYISGVYNINPSINLQSSFILQKSKEETLKSYNLGIDYDINDEMSFDITYSKERSSLQEGEYSIDMAFIYKFGKTTYSLDRSYDRKSDKTQSDISTISSIKYTNSEEKDISISAYNRDTALQKSSQDLSARVDTDKYKFYSKYKKDTNRKDHLNISLQSAVAFAGNKAVITKPINNSFIIVSNNTENQENIVGVKNHSIQKDIALSNNDYYTKKLELDESKLKRNYSLEKSTLYAKSTYKSGTLINIELPIKYSLKGVLYDEKDNPISYTPFEIELKDSDKTYLTFTNAKGVFYLENLDPGDYRGTYINPKSEQSGKSFSFRIDKKRENLQVDIGKVFVR